ncbi:MAG: arginase family protein, partial [Thermostichales cyanobacterium DRC_bins_46]
MARWSLQPAPSAQAQVVLIPTAFGIDTQAPGAILAAGSQISAFEPALQVDVDDLAIAQVAAFPDEPPYGMCEAAVQQALSRRQWPVLLPSVMAASLGAIRALWKHHPSLRVVVCSAHPGLRPAAEVVDQDGDPQYNSQTWVERLYQLQIPVVHVGVRSSSKKAWDLLQQQAGQRLFHSHAPWQPQEVVAALPDQGVFLAIDCNVLDPTLIPTVLNPEPGGLDWHRLQTLIKVLFAHRPVLGVALGGLTVAEGTRQTARYGAR